ncbi:MAG TPA: hypothetical protein VHN99_01760 [Deinococcales bacterium]|nr:hypothetical protein [Deinococcales bacterium]
MNRFTKVTLGLVFTLGTLAGASALAQGAPPDAPGGTTQQGQFNPAQAAKMRAAFQKLQPVTDMSQEIGLFPELDKAKGLAFTKAQAQKLLPILKDLASRKDIKPADADKILANIEDHILTAAQLKWIDTTILAQQEQARQRAAARAKAAGTTGGARGGFIPGVGGFGGGFGGNRGGPNTQQSAQARQAAQADRQSMMDAILNGKAYNPFKYGRAKTTLADLIATLSKR